MDSPKEDWKQHSGLCVVGFKGIFMSTYEVGGSFHGHEMTIFLFQIMVYQMAPSVGDFFLWPSSTMERIL